MTHSMLDALTRVLTKPLKYYVLTEHTDIHWTAKDDMEVNGYTNSIEVFMQDEEPVEVGNWQALGGKWILADQRDPELLVSSRREARGFKRVPGKITF